MPFFDNYFYVYNVDKHRVEWYLKRHSFDHRICNDLCEVVLSYLSIEDKHNLECVSKQFRSTIFERIHVLNASELKFHDKNDRNICNIFEAMIRKCRNITIIKTKFTQYTQFTCNPFYGYYSNSILNTIINHCTSLKSIEFGLYSVNNEMIERFGLRFGEFLKSIKSTESLWSRESQYSDKLQHLLKYCPNLISLYSFWFQDFMNTDSNPLLVPKLKKLNTYYGTKDIEAMVLFCDKYKNTIESLEIRTDGSVTNSDYRILFQSILELNKLKSIEFGLKFIDYEMITKFGLKFGQSLKSIKSSQSLYLGGNQYSDKLQHLLKYCPNLISLNTYLFQDFMNTDSNWELLVPKLKKMKTYYATEDIEPMVMFCVNYKNTIESLEIPIYSQTLDAYKRLFQSLLGLNKLKNLVIDRMNDNILNSDEDIKTYLSYFSQKCHKFKVNIVAEDDWRENYYCCEDDWEENYTNDNYWSDDDLGES